MYSFFVHQIWLVIVKTLHYIHYEYVFLSVVDCIILNFTFSSTFSFYIITAILFFTFLKVFVLSCISYFCEEILAPRLYED